jgi:hypothetical protein
MIKRILKKNQTKIKILREIPSSLALKKVVLMTDEWNEI